MFIEHSAPLLLRSGYKSTQTSSNEERWPVAEKDPPHTSPPPPQLRISLQFLRNRQFRAKTNRGSCRRGDNSKHGANVQDAGIRSSSGALFPPHFYLLALFRRAANWASALGCVGAHLRIYPSPNPILMYPSMLGAGEVTETGGIMASKPNSPSGDRSCNHSKSRQRVRMQSWSSGGQD